MICNCCPRSCSAERTDFENKGGFCAMPLLPKIARADLHFWEEPCISGKNGSGAIFFSGCSMKCVYCQNYEISHKNKGRVISVNELADLMKRLEAAGAHNINFVNPTHYFYAIRQALEIYRPNIPLVYNSGGYDKTENIAEDLFDVYLLDIKYVSDDVSLKYSGTADYFKFAAAAAVTAHNLCGEAVFDKDGIMRRGVIVRHLVLPLHTKDGIGVINFVNKNLPNAYLSLMAQYMPCGKADEYPEINRCITKREYDKVVGYAMDLGLKNVYIQSRKSADNSFIPDFNF